MTERLPRNAVMQLNSLHWYDVKPLILLALQSSVACQALEPVYCACLSCKYQLAWCLASDDLAAESERHLHATHFAYAETCAAVMGLMLINVKTRIAALGFVLITAMHCKDMCTYFL